MQDPCSVVLWVFRGFVLIVRSSCGGEGFPHAPELISPRFLFEYLTAFKDELLVSQMIGTANVSLSVGKVSDVPVPLVPPSVQQKVDELMVLCDRLEAARAEREARRNRLAAAIFTRLSALDPGTFQDDARFALDTLPALTARPDQIKQLRQTILNFAVHGKLVPQDPNDEPASELLKRIAAERADLVKCRLLRREDPLDPILPRELPFDVPHKWLWSRIGEVVLFTQYGTSQKSNAAEKGIPVLTMGNIQDGLVVWNHEKKIPESSEELPALFLSKFDILYNRTNSAELVGKTGIYLGENSIRTFASYLIRLRPSLVATDPRYLNMAMNAPEFRATQIIPLIKKQTGQANVNGTALKNMLIPLPPLAEQRRIVAKVGELMALCNRLEASLDAAIAIRQRLLEGLLHEALEPTAKALEAAE
jgi:type I restriction enzyme S subunit